MQLLSKAIHGILTADTDITDTVGSGNIWHSKIPQRTTAGSDAPVPISIYFYTYAVNPTGSTKSGRAEIDEHMIRVSVVGSDDEDMYSVARYIRYALDRITPGTYSDIPIQGIEFLNASFDPEGSYELENQSWVLEFKVRVIDNDIRVPPTDPPLFPTSSRWYSRSEQVWLDNKWFEGETIYWMSGELSSATDYTTYNPTPAGGGDSDGYLILDTIPAHVVDFRIWHRVDETGISITPEKYWQSPGVGVLKLDQATDGKMYMPAAVLFEGNSIWFSIWYTKT